MPQIIPINFDPNFQTFYTNTNKIALPYYAIEINNVHFRRKLPFFLSPASISKKLLNSYFLSFRKFGKCTSQNCKKPIYYWCLVMKSRLMPCNPMDCSPPSLLCLRDFSARIQEWVAISFSRESSPSRDQTCISCLEGRFFYHWVTRSTKSQQIGTNGNFLENVLEQVVH